MKQQKVLLQWLKDLEMIDDKDRISKLRSKDIRRGKAPRPMEVSHESNGTQTK